MSSWFDELTTNGVATAGLTSAGSQTRIAAPQEEASRMRKWLGLLLVTVVAVGCNSAKAPAQAALSAVETGFAAVKGEAAKYVPDQEKAVEDGIAAAKASFDKGDYQGALTAAQALAGQVSALGSAVAVKKTELAKDWAGLAADVPATLASITSKLTQIDATKHLPAGLTADSLNEAKTGAASLSQAWTEASDAFKAGNMADALAKATDVKSKAGELASKLGVQTGIAGAVAGAMAGVPNMPNMPSVPAVPATK